MSETPLIPASGLPVESTEEERKLSRSWAGESGKGLLLDIKADIYERLSMPCETTKLLLYSYLWTLIVRT